ncbi:twin-arginine translocase TatA/TatE family subunit [Herbiconiux sp. L3-i23]|jgi:sec-independent protein translocase protein TatA|uniref:twin-arginine translocase TatA/TatE family subunit n=1 Tax=Herbiconiux sp. L3-i23 TaxID=2905871 RepID=UPI002050413A|nr:twin-arginine translocase TatA/TatE family subunit [Herbiconiux sp. L3-i23]BDI22641.1 hypothetical protein L3i23_14170 [Herbiconiux sp. L3-i23]
MLGNLTGWHFLIVLIVILLVFGATKLPALAKSVGQSMKIFRNEIQTDKVETEKRDAETPVVYTEEPPAGMAAPAASEPDHKPEK